MNYNEIIEAIIKARSILVYCYIEPHEGEFFEVPKASVFKVIKKQKWWLTDSKANAHIANGVLKIGEP